MSRIQTTAPGKLILLGEYVVLEGHPAVGLAVERRAKVSWRDADSARSTIQLEPISRQIIGWPSIDDRTHPPAVMDALGQIDSIFEWLASSQCKRGFNLNIDTRALYDSNGKKLGLGSSAAVAVALAGLARRLGGQSMTDHELHAGLCSHHQGGSGSGLDLAISMLGGLVHYQRDPQMSPLAQWTSMGWPDELQGLLVMTGQAASTPQFVSSYRAWKAMAPEAWRRVTAALSECCLAAIESLQRGDWAGFLEGFTEYGVRLGTMGGLMGRDVVDKTHAHLGTLGQRMGVAYKPCGAGGGDVGLFLSDDAERLASLSVELKSQQMNTMSLKVATTGLQVSLSDDGETIGSAG